MIPRTSLKHHSKLNNRQHQASHGRSRTPTFRHHVQAALQRLEFDFVDFGHCVVCDHVLNSKHCERAVWNYHTDEFSTTYELYLKERGPVDMTR